MRIPEITHPDDRQCDWEAFQRVVRGEAADYRSGEARSAQGRQRGVGEREHDHPAGCRRGALPHHGRHRGYYRAKTDRGEAAQAVGAVEQCPALIVITDTAGAIQYVNPKFSQLTGYAVEEAIGQNPRILKSGETSPEEYQRLWETIAAGKEWRGEFHNKKKNGDLYWELASISPVVDGAGRITHYVAVKEDITERKRAEEALRTSEQRHRLLFERSRDALLTAVPPAWKFASANAAAVELFGAKAEAELLAPGPGSLSPDRQPGGRDSVRNGQGDHRNGDARGLSPLRMDVPASSTARHFPPRCC